MPVKHRALNSITPKLVTEYGLRSLSIVKVVVENGGFSAVERELGVTRSTMSVHKSNRARKD